jgi:hypothetical protein
MTQRHVGIAMVAPLILCLSAGLAHGQFRKGFARSTIEVVLNRKRPPKVVILGAAIKIEVTSLAGRETLAQRFATTLETQLLANESRLRPEPSRPETIIFCAINRLDTSQTAGSRQAMVSRRVGTKQVYNEKKRTYEQQPVYDLVPETQHFTTVKGDIAVSVQVRDRRTGATIDSQAFTPAYLREFPAGTTPFDPPSVEQALIQMATDLAVQRLTPTRQSVKVLLARPSDEIDDINRLGEAGLWGRMLERLELTKPLNDPQKEAYRAYNLGVANEALAYATDEIETSRKLLELASSHYGRSIELNPDEKYFREPQNRIAEGIAAYAELDRQRAIIAAAPPAPSADAPLAGAEGARSLTAPPGPAGPMGNQDVIALVSDGLDEPNLLAALKEAKAVAFDLSTAGLQQLLKGKVSNRVIAAMRLRQGQPAAPPPKPRPRRPGASQSEPREP